MQENKPKEIIEMTKSKLLLYERTDNCFRMAIWLFIVRKATQ